MKQAFDPSLFNVASGANKRPPMAWLLLGASMVFLGACLYPLAHGLTRLQDARVSQAALSKAVQRQVAEQRKRSADRNNTASQEREKIRTQIQEFVHMSWDGIFDALEVAADTVHAGVSIISLAPAKVNGSATQLSITALAANLPIMLAYIEALKRDPRVSLVEISSQQPEEKVGPAVLRFRASVVLNPRITVLRPLRESAASAPVAVSSTAASGAAALPEPSRNAFPAPVRPPAGPPLSPFPLPGKR